MEISGLTLALTGMSIVFLTLTILTIITYLIDRIFGERREGFQEEKEIIALIATAIAESEIDKTYSFDERDWVRDVRVQSRVME
ncbi:MAG: OadG family transporter subunit [Candidatus Methanofastidiosia archaeon]